MARHIEHPRAVSLRSPRVQWSRWADGQWWRLSRGPDFPQTPYKALRAARSWATRNGYQVTGTISGPGSVDIKITQK